MQEIKYYFESLTAWKAACDYFNANPRATAQDMADATSMNFRIAKKYRTIWKEQNGWDSLKVKSN